MHVLTRTSRATGERYVIAVFSTHEKALAYMRQCEKLNFLRHWIYDVAPIACDPLG